MLEQLLITYSAPTLAGIKTGSLFNYCFESEGSLLTEVQHENRRLNGKGIRLEILRIRKSSALILTYRMGGLIRDLKKEETVAFLKQSGYEQTDPEYAISRLKERFAGQDGFPHEIGLFLGYPLKDVVGFIENGGQNSKLAGYWKVYCNEEEALKRFDRFKKCGDLYMKLFAGGRSIMQLIVAA